MFLLYYFLYIFLAEEGGAGEGVELLSFFIYYLRYNVKNVM